MKSPIKLVLSILAILVLAQSVYGQNIGQTIKGSVVDKQSQQPLKGVQISILGTEPLFSTVTDSNGNYRILEVFSGRYDTKM